MRTTEIPSAENASMDDERLLSPVYWGLIAESYPSVVHVSIEGDHKTLCGRVKGMLLEGRIVKETKWWWDSGSRSTEIPDNRFCKNCFKKLNR